RDTVRRCAQRSLHAHVARQRARAEERHRARSNRRRRKDDTATAPAVPAQAQRSGGCRCGMRNGDPHSSRRQDAGRDRVGSNTGHARAHARQPQRDGPDPRNIASDAWQKAALGGSRATHGRIESVTNVTMDRIDAVPHAASPVSFDDVVREARSLERNGRWAAARSRYESLLDDDALTAAARSSLLRWIGRTHAEEGNPDTAFSLLERAVAAAEASGEVGVEAHALNGLAVVEQTLGNLDRSEELYLRARI